MSSVRGRLGSNNHTAAAKIILGISSSFPEKEGVLLLPFYVTTPSYLWMKGRIIAQMSDFCDYLGVTHCYEL
jgi:hypothetical protein